MNQTEKGEGNNTDGHNGHSRRIQERLIAYRRDQVFALSTKGYSQSKIANILNVSQGLISSDIAYLRQRAREALANYLENKLPSIFQESITGISDVISQTWEIANNPNVSHHDSLHALSLVADCNERRLDMASNGSIIEDGIRFVQEARQRLVTITPESAKEMLHDDNNNSDDVNINDAYNAKEEVMNKEQGEVGGERDEKNNRGKNNNSSSSDGNSGSSTSSSCSDHEQKTSYAADTTNELLQQQQDNDRDEKSSNSNKEGMFKQGKKPRNTVF